MTRIKEYLELLTSEMEGFQSDVNRLETIHENLKNLKVSIDLKELKSELREYHAQLERQREDRNQFYTRLETLVKQAGIHTNRAMITFILVILTSAALLFYAYNT